MLHRMSMRVLPVLTVAVTEPGIRGRKRLVMLLPGLAAYALYRILKSLQWHSDIVVLLIASGVFSGFVAVLVYARGRQCRLTAIAVEEGAGWLAWIGLRLGMFYAVQLSLMVLALLKLAGYGYHEHPDGPALMALIIASASVARDAFEIGHLRLLSERGRPLGGLPDGKELWAFILSRPDVWGRRVGEAVLAVGLIYGILMLSTPMMATDLGQLLAVGVLAGGTGTLAYIQSLQHSIPLWRSVSAYAWRELARFYLWPGLAFSWTYYLVIAGVTSFLLNVPDPPRWERLLVTVGIGGLMSLYCSYLGWRRSQEDQLQATISPSMLRCPFVLGVLTSKKA